MDDTLENNSIKKTYSVADVKRILSVNRVTVYKWIDYGVIPAEAWFKLPNGHYRIHRWAVEALMK